MPYSINIPCTINTPGDKSMANRALICAALAHGTSTLSAVPYGSDVDCMIETLKILGAKITVIKNKHHRTLKIIGTGGAITPIKKIIYTKNAGTVTRFLTALLTLSNKKCILKGNAEMDRRPIAPLVEALNKLGASIEYGKTVNHTPLIIKPKKPNGGTVRIDSSMSSQFISALILLAPYLNEPLTIKPSKDTVSRSYIDRTVAVIRSFGAKVVQKKYSNITIYPGRYKAIKMVMEPDAVSASYAAAVGLLHNRTGARLKPFGTIDGKDCPDTAVTLMALAACIQGKTRFINIGHLRYKESDRMQAMQNELTKLGIRVQTTRTTMTIWGTDKYETLNRNVNIKTYNDHRIAMAFSIIKSVLPRIEIENTQCVQKSYPNYWRDYRAQTKRRIQEMNKNFILIGMRGAGKTTLARALGKKIKYQWYDTDAIVQKRAGKTIEKIVKQEGWKSFRKQEHAAIRDIAQKKRCVIATGGGAILDPRNMKLLKKNGIVIYLKTPVKILAQRTGADATVHHRPPLAKELAAIYKERRHLYEQYADITINYV